MLSTLQWQGTGATSPDWSKAVNWLNTDTNSQQVPANGDQLIFPAQTTSPATPLNTSTIDDIPTLSVISIELDADYSFNITGSSLSINNASNPNDSSVAFSGTGSLSTSGTGTLTLPQNITNTGPIRGGGPIHLGMSTKVPTRPKITQSGTLSIGGAAGDATNPLLTVPNIEVDGTFDASKGQLDVVPPTQSTVAKLSGTGTVIAGNGVYVGSSTTPSFTSGTLTVDPSGTISPGGDTTTGPLTINGNVIFQANASLSIGLGSLGSGSAADQLVLPATDSSNNPTSFVAAITGANLNFTNPSALAPGTYTILEAPRITGTFATVNGNTAVTAGTPFTVGGIPFLLNYSTTAGSNGEESVTLTSLAIPKSNLEVYLPATGSFAIRPSSGGPDQITQFGTPGAGSSIPVPADYDNSGKTELAVYLTSTGTFAYRPANGGPDKIIQFGIPGVGNSIPVPGDYDNSGRTELAVYLPSTGSFAYRPANGGPDKIIQFGASGTGQSIPVPGDYDNSGKTELAVYLTSTGSFAYRPANGGPDKLIQFGTAGVGQSIPIPGDYDGSGKTELAVYLPAQGAFAYRPANGGFDKFLPFGSAGAGASIPVPGNYDNSGQTELAVYLPASGSFAYRPANGSSDQFVQFGSSGPGGSVPLTGFTSAASTAYATSTLSEASVTSASKVSSRSLPTQSAGSSTTLKRNLAGTSVSRGQKLLVVVPQNGEDKANGL